MTDNDTGAGAYKISGGSNGGIIGFVGCIFLFILSISLVSVLAFPIFLAFMAALMAATFSLLISIPFYQSGENDVASTICGFGVAMLITAAMILLLPFTVALAPIWGWVSRF